LKKIWTSAELSEIRARLNLVAGSISDFQSAGGLVVVRNIAYEGQSIVKIYLSATSLSIKTSASIDGIDLVAEEPK
jgi:hypothetical protein